MRMMLVLAVLMLAGATAQAQDTTPQGILSIPGLTQAIADYAKEARVVGNVDLHGTYGTGMVVPVRTLKDGAGIRYAAMCIGGNIEQKQHLKPDVTTMVDISSVYRRMEKKWTWWDAHTEKVLLPNFWLGPTLGLPVPGDPVTWKSFGNITTWADYAKVALSVGF
jgi:hypothetical protein